LKDANFCGSLRSVLTMSPDGRILYVPGEGVTINAVDVQTHSVKWRYGTGPRLLLAPLVDSDGNIYVLGMDSLTIPRPSLICLRPDGSVRWSFAHDNCFDQINAGDPTIDMDGNVYFILDTLYCVGPDGVLRWKRGFGDPASAPAGDVPLLCDEMGYIYAIVTTPAPFTRNTLYIFDKDGSTIRSLEFANGLVIDSSPAILWDGSMVVTGLKNQALYMLK